MIDKIKIIILPNITAELVERIPSFPSIHLTARKDCIDCIQRRNRRLEKCLLYPVDSEITVPHYIGWFRMQIRLLFQSVPRAPPPSSGVHCPLLHTRVCTQTRETLPGYSSVHVTRTRETHSGRYKYINNNIRGGSGIRYNYSSDAGR